MTNAMGHFHIRPSVDNVLGKQVEGLPPKTDDIASPQSARDTAKIHMLRKIRPPTLKYAWTFYHDKHSPSADYEGRLTTMLENIVTIKTFWEFYNQFPLERLQMKDSVHFFKRGVRPVWEDRRNLKGGAWTFRVPKAQSERFWKEVLMMAIGEQFASVIQPGDDLCGCSLSVRFNSNLISIWNRQGLNQKSIDGIRDVVLAILGPELKPREGSFYYKQHSEHAGFNDVVAKAKEVEDAKSAQTSPSVDDGKIVEAEVQEGEGDMALLKDEGVDVGDLRT